MVTGQELAALVGGIVTTAAVARAIHGAVKTGLGVWGVLPWGRRRRHAHALRLLDVGQVRAAFTRALGEHDRMVSDTLGRRFIYEDRDATVTALVDADEVVVAYHVTTGSARFHPRITLVAPPSVPSLRSVLGRTTFGELGEPAGVTGFLGANRWDYREVHYLGNPGRYHYYLLTHGMNSPTETPRALFDALRESDLDPTSATLGLPAEIPPALAAARAVTAITGYGVINVAGLDSWQSL